MAFQNSAVDKISKPESCWEVHFLFHQLIGNKKRTKSSVRFCWGKKKMLVLSHSLHHHLFFLISNYISSVMWKLLDSSVSKWYIVGNKLDLLPELHYNAQEHILLTYFTPPELSDGFSYDEMRLHKYEILLLSILWVHFPHHTYILLFKVL